MKQSIVLFIFALFCLYKTSTAGGGAGGYSGDADDAYLSDIDCGTNGAEITFSINIPDIDWWGNNVGDESKWQLRGATGGSVCQPNSFDGAVHYGPFNAQECAQQITTDDVYNVLEVLFEVRVDPTENVVTFQYDHRYRIRCDYSTIDDTLQASFVPLHSVSSDGSDNGDLTFSFDLYFTYGGGLVTSDYIIDLESELYGELSIVRGGFSGLDVHFEQLIAVSDSGTEWPLILYGCSQDAGIVTDLTCADAEVEQVDFLAFRFGGQSGFVSVTFFVTAIVCLPDEDSNRCDTDCLTCEFSSDGPSFERRSVDVNRVVKTKYYLEVGPYKFGKVNKKNQKGADDLDEGDSSTFPTYLIAILVVSGVVAIAIVSGAVVIVLRKRRRNATLSESSGNSESGTGPV